jgi:hypothetical protein
VFHSVSVTSWWLFVDLTAIYGIDLTVWNKETIRMTDFGRELEF